MLSNGLDHLSGLRISEEVQPSVQGDLHTGTSYEVTIHSVQESFLIFIRWNDRNLLAGRKILLGFILQSLSKCVAT